MLGLEYKYFYNEVVCPKTFEELKTAVSTCYPEIEFMTIEHNNGKEVILIDDDGKFAEIQGLIKNEKTVINLAIKGGYKVQEPEKKERTTSVQQITGGIEDGMKNAGKALEKKLEDLTPKQKEYLAKGEKFNKQVAEKVLELESTIKSSKIGQFISQKTMGISNYFTQKK